MAEVTVGIQVIADTLVCICYTSGLLPSVLRSQMTSPSYVDHKDAAGSVAVTLLPRSVLNVERSSCAIHAARNSQWHFPPQQH